MTIQLVYKENRADPSILKILWSEGENLLRHTPVPFGTAKVIFPNIVHETNNHLPFGNQDIRQAIRQTNKIVLVTHKDGRKEYEPREFYEEYSELIKKFRMGTHPAQFVDQATNNAVKNEVVRLLKTQTIQSNTTDCWYPGNFDFGLVYGNMDGKKQVPSPVRKVRVLMHDGTTPFVENANHDFQHPLYHLMNGDVCDKKEVAEFFERFAALIVPKERLQYFETIVDYFFASLMKNDMRSGAFGPINYPILLIVGEQRVGKTWMAQTLLRIIYGFGHDDIFFYNKTVLQGANPMTRLRLEYNSVFPIIFEEIDNFSRMQEIINPYLTEAILQDIIGGKEKITRTAYYSPIVLSNNILIIQPGSNAIMDRFFGLKMVVPPETNNKEIQMALAEFDKKYCRHNSLVQQIGATIVKTIVDNKTEIIDCINEQLEKDDFIGKMDNRNTSKLKFFLVGKHLREKIFDMLGVAPMTNNDVEWYSNQVIHGTESEHITSSTDSFAKAFGEIWTKPIKDYAEHNIYLGDMYSGVGEGIVKGIRNRDVANNFTEEQEKFLKHCYYLAQEYNIRHTTEHGVVIITKQFLRQLSKGQFKLRLEDFEQMFRKYSRFVMSYEYIGVSSGLDATGKRLMFDYEIEHGSKGLKFDLIKYLNDDE